MSAVGGVEVLDLAFVATEAITKYRFVKLDGGAPRGIDMCDTAGESSLGVAMHDVSAGDAALGAHCNVRLMGIAVVEAGGTVTVGGDVQTDTSGRAVDAAAADRVLGFALQGTTNAGDLITVVLAGPSAQYIHA